MASETEMTSTEKTVSRLCTQLTIARNELQNIRQDLRKMKHCYQKDMDNILDLIRNWKCESCFSLSTKRADQNIKNDRDEGDSNLTLQPIGLISSSFEEKKGTPRQPGICINSHAKFTLFNSIFTNPDHALEGLEHYSHMWIMFHFHKNDSTHVRAKVAPPRLNGLKTGVFGTRSPHRPSPIGLSLVRIDRIEGSSVYFSGVDMLNGTPVLDIKPYIPQYDNPFNMEHEHDSKFDDACGSSCEQNDCVHMPREAPDGEECDAPGCSSKTMPFSPRLTEQVRVPQWISEPLNAQLTVTYKERAKSYLNSLQNNETNNEVIKSNVGNLEHTITRILEEDPRSVYVRDRYSNQFYTFLIENHHVSCKFDDSNHSVQVYKITKASPLLEWRGSFDDCGQDE